MALNDAAAVRAQYRTEKNLEKRISIHEKYSVNRQGFGNWIASQYQIGQGMAVLELGCGTGEMWRNQDTLAARCAPLVLSDASAGMLDAARKNLEHLPGIVYQTIDIQRIPYADQSFDVVIANMVLHHVPDIPKALSEVRRVLRPDGAFYCAAFGEHGIAAYLCGLFASYGVKEDDHPPFTLQNGAKQLEAFFAKVSRRDYADALAVTDLADMADYISSLTGMAALQNLPRETVLAVLEKHTRDGVLHVPKEYGLFICR